MNSWEKLPIGEIFSLEKGTLQSTKCTPGDYTFITASSEWKTHNDFSHDCEALIYAVAASGSLGRCHHFSGKFISSDLCFILRAKNEKKRPINYRFYQNVFRFLKKDIVAKTKSGTSKESISQKRFSAYTLPYIDIEHQAYWENKLNKLNEYIENFDDETLNQSTYLTKLRQAILQEAIEGKLTSDWRKKTLPLFKGESAKREGVGNSRLNNLQHLKTFRKTLRSNLTPSEARLWTYLKNKQLENRKFRRQHSVGNYILDFYCPEESLAIELDGEVHNNEEAQLRDKERDLFLNHYGIRVLRFENKVVFENPEGLLAEIKSWFGKTPPGHLPLAGEELNPSGSSSHLPLAGEELWDAKALLEKIQAEKEKLIKEGKIKKQKPLAPIKAEEVPFELPEGWVWCKIDSLVYSLKSDIRTGPFGSALHKHDHKSIGHPVWGIESIGKDGSFQYRNKIFVDDAKAIELRAFRVSHGDIIISRSGTVGELCLIPEDVPAGFISTNLLKISLYKEVILPEYFIFLFKGTKSITDQLEELCFGTTRTFITQTILSKLMFPLPSIQEQMVIVNRIKNYLSLIDEMEKQVSERKEQSQHLMQAVLREAFEGKS